MLPPFPCGFALRSCKPPHIPNAKSFPVAQRFPTPRTTSSTNTPSTSNPYSTSVDRPDPSQKSQFHELTLFRDYHLDPADTSSNDSTLDAVQQMLGHLRMRETQYLQLKIDSEITNIQGPKPNWYCLHSKDFLYEQQRFKAFSNFEEELHAYRSALLQRESQLSSQR
ncbi:hypothetical protein GEMRC1_014151 [Eukaryota sp. GEM-RC1]